MTDLFAYGCMCWSCFRNVLWWPYCVDVHNNYI